MSNKTPFMYAISLGLALTPICFSTVSAQEQRAISLPSSDQGGFRSKADINFSSPGTPPSERYNSATMLHLPPLR
jgi:hypothetical protein